MKLILPLTIATIYEYVPVWLLRFAQKIMFALILECDLMCLINLQIIFFGSYNIIFLLFRIGPNE